MIAHYNQPPTLWLSTLVHDTINDIACCCMVIFSAATKLVIEEEDEEEEDIHKPLIALPQTWLIKPPILALSNTHSKRQLASI